LSSEPEEQVQYQYPVKYTDAWQYIVDRALWQVYYRLLGAVPVLTDFNTVVEACEWLAANVRGGTVSLLRAAPHRIAQWDGLTISPDLPDSTTFSIWIIGLFENAPQKRTLLLRKGFWTLYLPNYVGVASIMQSLRAPPAQATALR
jgi:hypothetical protein